MLWSGTTPPMPPLQYADFAVWQRDEEASGRMGAKLDYWRAKLSGAEPAELPTDRPRPVSDGPRRGGELRAVWPAELTARLEALGRQSGATLFMVLTAGLKAVMHRWSGGSEDVCLGTVLASRNQVRSLFRDCSAFVVTGCIKLSGRACLFCSDGFVCWECANLFFRCKSGGSERFAGYVY